MDLVKALNSQYMKEELPEVQVGDTVRVHVRIKEGSRERIQVFEGTVIARKHYHRSPTPVLALSDASTGIAARLYRRVAVSPLKDDPSNGRSAPLAGR